MNKIFEQIKNSIKINKFSDLFSCDSKTNSEIFHTNYLFLFLIEFILFAIVIIILYMSSRSFSENLQSDTIFVPKGIKEKYEQLIYLCQSILLRLLSLIYIIMFSNKTGLDWISFINIFVHVIPSFVFLMSFYLYIGFIIEKYYQLSDKRIYISSTLKYILYFSLLLVLIISISAIVFKLYRESYFFIETVMSLNYLIIGFLYLIYGRKITSLLNETNKNRINNPSIMKNIRKMITSRIIPTCFIICVSYLIIGSIEGLVAIDTFGNFYPDFMDLNIFDSIIFLFCELIPSVMIGYNKKSWSNFKMEELVNQSNDDLNEREFLRVGNIGIIHGNKTLEEQMEEMLKKFIDEKNSDNVLD